MSIRCVYEDCLSVKYPCSRMAFFRLPSDERRSCWIRNSGNKSLLKIGPKAQRFFCENHFRKCDINSQFNRKLLKKDAVPIEHDFLVVDKEVSEYSSVYGDGSIASTAVNKINHENTELVESLEENTDYQNLYNQIKVLNGSTTNDTPADVICGVPYRLLDFCDDYDDELATATILDVKREEVETKTNEKQRQGESLEIYIDENSNSNQVDSSTLELGEQIELEDIETLDDDRIEYAIPAKKKRPHETIVETANSENIQLPPSNNNNNSYEEDKHFALSLVGYFQRLPRGKKALAKLKILQYLTELEIDSQSTCL